MTDLQTAAPIEKIALERYVAPEKPSQVGMTRTELAEALAVVGVPEKQRKMRVQQLWHWIYVRGVQDIDAMTTISKELRAQLGERFTVARPEVVAEQVSNDGTYHAVDLRRGAEHRTRGRRDRLHAGDFVACRARRTAQRTGAA